MSQNQARGYAGTGFGDSGGPTFWVDPDTGARILVGITSRGDAQTVATGFAFRTDTQEALEFVDFAKLVAGDD